MKSAVLELTYKCNLSCPFCYCAWHDHPDAFGPEIALSQWEGILRKCLCEGVASFTITGGEPTLYEGVEDIVKLATSCDGAADCELYSNLRVVPQWIVRVPDKGRFRVTTSLQGLFGRASAVGMEWPLESWQDNCRKIIDGGVKLGIAITVTKQNVDDLEHMIICAAELGAWKIWVNTMVIEGRGVNHPELWLNAEEISGVYERARSLRNAVAPEIRLPGEFYCSCRPNGIVPAGYDVTDGVPCEAAKHMIVFGPDGRRRKCMHIW